MANTAYISAGLPVAKNSGQSPTAGVNTAYVSAGLPAAPTFFSTSTSLIGSITSYSRSSVTNLYNQIGGKGVRRRSFSQRPDTFTIDPTHYLARGLVFAGLGPGDLRGSTYYRDSSLYGNHGTLTNMDPATDWVFDPYLGRSRLTFLGTNSEQVTKYVLGLVSYPHTFSVWLRAPAEQQIYGVMYSNALANYDYYGLSLMVGTAFTYAYRHSSTQWISAGTPVADTWYHLCGVSSASNSHQLFVNGVSIGTNTTDSTPNACTWLTIGWLYRTSTVYGTGDVADPLIFNRALTVAEIQQLADPSNTMLSGLIRHPKRTIFKSVVSNFPTTQYTRLSLCALPTRPYKTFIAKTQYTPPIIVLTRHFTPLQLFQNTI